MFKKRYFTLSGGFAIKQSEKTLHTVFHNSFVWPLFFIPTKQQRCMYLGYSNSDKKTGNHQFFLFYHTLLSSSQNNFLGFKSRSIVKKNSDVMGNFFLIWIDRKTENIKMHYPELTRKTVWKLDRNDLYNTINFLI